MKKLLKNQRGSALLICLLALLVLGGMLTAVSPMVFHEMKLNKFNKDMVDAQYAAEAGAKVAIAGIYAKSSNWSWLNTDQNLLANDTTKRYNVNVVTTGTTTVLTSTAVAGNYYTITSTGKAGNAAKTVTVKVQAGSSGSVLKYAIFSYDDMTLNQSTITGDVATNSMLTDWSGTVSGSATADVFKGKRSNISGKTYCNTVASGSSVTSCDYAMSTISTFSVSSYMQSATAIPALPTIDYSSFTSISSGSNLKAGSYICSSDYNSWGNKSYTINSGKSLILYIQGSYAGNASIKGGGDITIYATGDVSFNQGSTISGNSVKIYSGGAINLYGDTSISGSTAVTMQATGAISNWSSKSISGGTVSLISSDVISLGSSTTTTGSSIFIQSAGAMNLYGPITQSTSDGTVTVYSGGSLAIQEPITAGTVTVIAPSLAFNSNGAINKTLSGSISRVYITGDVALNSSLSIGTNGYSMIVSTGSITDNGSSLATTLLLAKNSVTVNGGSVGGVYAETGTVTTSGSAKVTYSSSIVTALGFSDTSSSALTILSWGK